MKTIITIILVLIISQAFAQYQYLSPSPGSTLVNPEHNIVIREGNFIDPAFLRDEFFNIQGSKSGNHDFKLTLSTDGKTIILSPASPFDFNEEVTVTIAKGLRTSQSKIITPHSYSFFTHRKYSDEEMQRIQKAPAVAWDQEMQDALQNADAQTNADPRSVLTGTYTITVNTTPAPGYVFFDSFNGLGTPTVYDGFHIITSNGDSIYSNTGHLNLVGDWDINPDGYLSYMNPDSERFEILDSNYNLIDSYQPVNGYAVDAHEFTRFANGHAFFLADETQIMDLSVYNPNYSHNATVTWGVVQEFDENKNLVFEWRAFDHVAITETNQALGNSYVDATHTNSIEVDADGNLILSHRSLNQVTKIDHNTGAFIWRLGGQQNQFTFINDAEQFNFQHDARILSNGHLTLYDNGNSHPSHHSVAKEYELNPASHTATLVWSYGLLNFSGNPAYFPAMGSVQRLSNGNTFIDGGLEFTTTQPNLTEVDPNGNVVWQLALDNTNYLICYRAHRYIWNPCAPVDQQSIDVKKITTTSARVVWDAGSNAVSYDVQYKNINKQTWKVKNATSPYKKLVNLVAGKTYQYQVRTHCANGYISDWSTLKTFTTAPLKFGVAQVSSEPSLNLEVRPNPVNDILTLDWNADEDDAATVSVYDMSGKLLLTSSGFSAADESHQLNVASLSPGFYFAEMKTSNAREMVEFVKQ